LSAGVVDQELAEVVFTEEDLDVVGEGEDAGVGGDNAWADDVVASRGALEAVLGEGDTDFFAEGGSVEGAAVAFDGAFEFFGSDD
jgi:hypothetical protein